VHWKIVAIFHTHPNPPGVKSLGHCPVVDAHGNQVMTAGTPYESGPSTADWDFSTQLPALPTNYLTGAPIDGYIMDAGHVYRYNGITTPSMKKSDVKWHSYNPKSATGCP
jgi:hypothetical protein